MKRTPRQPAGAAPYLDHYLSVRLSAEERDLWHALARAKGEPLSSLLRRLVLAEARRSAPTLAAELRAIRQTP